MNAELMYTRENASGWLTELVDASTYDTGWYSSIAVDGEGMPHISYYDRGAVSVAYAFRTPGGWQIEDLGHRGKWTSLALDDEGSPHLVYCDTEETFYAHRDGGQWGIESIGVGSLYTSIALDASGDPSLSFMEEIHFQGAEALEYASRHGGTWEVETVTPSGDVGTYAAMTPLPLRAAWEAGRNLRWTA